MTRAGKSAVFLVLSVLFMSVSSPAQSSGQLDELVALFDSTAIVEANVFAPKAYEKAKEKFDKAEEAIEAERSQKGIDKLIARIYRERVEGDRSDPAGAGRVSGTAPQSARISGL